MKIRWYHWLVYRLFYYFWNPILAENKYLREMFVEYMSSWQPNKSLTTSDKRVY